jgi:hypothetical protein
VLLCADASAPLCADGLTQLADVVRRAGSQPGAVLFFEPMEDHVEIHARAVLAFAAARTLAEAGRLAPVIVIDLNRTAQLENPAAPGDPATARYDSLAGALDALLRLAIMPSAGPVFDPSAVKGHILSKGWSTIGFAATKDDSRASLEAAFSHALGPGLMAQAMPPSRARAAFVCTVVGDDLARDGSTLEPARAILAKLLPQAQRLESTWHDSGKSVRIIAFVGGLPFPETFFTHGHS